MKINKITIQNFRIFEKKEEINFDNTYTCLVGKNGSGKTSLLEAIKLATDFYASNKIKDDDFYDCNKDIIIEVDFDKQFYLNLSKFIKIPSKKIQLTIKYREKASAGKLLSQTYIATHKIIPECGNFNTPNVPLEIRLTTDGYERFQKSDSRFVIIEDRSLNIYSQDDLEGFPEIVYFSKERDKDLSKGFSSIFSKIINELNWRFFNKYKSCPIKDEYIRDWEKIYDYIIKKVDDPKSSKIIQPLKNKINILGDKFEKFEISLLNIRQPFNSGFFSIRDSDNIISLSNLGSGELMFISYHLFKLINKDEDGDIIFLIDEPEIHLHPQLQYLLFDEIIKSENQTILTTHSDIFINLAEWKSLKIMNNGITFPQKQYLEKEYEGKKLTSHLEEVKKYHQDKSIFYRENNELLFSRKCLLVEGPNDKYGILNLSNIKNINISQCTIIYCNGKTKIPYYQIVCNSFGIDYFVLYDQDGDETSQENKRIKDFLNDKENVFSFKESFEKLIVENEDKKIDKIIDKIQSMQEEEIPDEINEFFKLFNEWLSK